MQKEQIKAILVNITTAGIVVSLLVAGYVVFFKKESTLGSSPEVIVSTTEEAATLRARVDRTVSDLTGLEHAVANSAVIFDLPSFKNLEDFSVMVPPEPVGRPNPFIPTDWKLKIKTVEESQKTSGGVVSWVPSKIHKTAFLRNIVRT